MLSERYRYDGKPLLSLNELQEKTKNEIERKIEKGIYQFESKKCIICGSNSFDLISEKDRYGLYMPVVVCTNCGLIQTNPRMTQESYNSFYNNEYRKLYSKKEIATKSFFQHQYYKGERIYNYLVKNKVFKKPYQETIVLEVGCGAGGILKYFKDRGFITKGIDIGQEYLLYGRSNYDLDLEIGTIFDVSISQNADVIIYSHVLEHILEPKKELSEVKNKLSENGIVYIEVPGIKNLMNSYDMDFLKLMQNAHIYHFTLYSLNNLMSSVGFGLIKGDDFIHSIYRIEQKTKKLNIETKEYKSIISYLNKVERARKIFLYPLYKPILLMKKIILRLQRIMNSKAFNNRK